ncbi:MAG: hypothetical protein IT443_11930 [Phycisphaeraceae bacterium]|nr:hypothetical protein [Phycisphaeraceae bacterium]
MMAKLTSRKFLLTLVSQITGILILMYPGHEDQITQVAANASGLLLVLLSTLGFIKYESSIDAARATSEGNSSTPETSSSSAAKVAKPFGALLLAATVAVTLGCAATPLQKTYQARESYSAVMRVLVAYAEAGKMDYRTAQQIEVARAAAAVALDRMEDAAKSDQPLTYKAAFASFSEAIDSLLLYEAQLEQKAKKKTD